MSDRDAGRETSRAASAARRVAAAALLLAAWETASGPLRLAHGLVPGPSEIAGRLAADGLSLYAGAALPTVLGAGMGWLLGNAAGVVAAVLAAVAPPLRSTLTTLALVAFCVPGIALGPVLAASGSPEMSRVVLAALPIAFLTLETLAAGAATVPAGARDAGRAFGGRRFGTLACIDLPASAPALLTALRISVPFALLGAISAEFLGAERGLGVLLVNAQHRLVLDRAWGIALLVAGGAALVSAALAELGRRLLPWSCSVPIEPVAGEDGVPRAGGRRGVAGIPASALRIAVGVAGWWAVTRLLHLPPLMAKGPLDVLAYLAEPSSGAARRGRLAAEMAVTAGDSLMGLACGAGVAVVCAVASAAAPALRALVIGPALAAQCLPVAAFAPLLVLAFGRGPAIPAALGALVIFVPVVLRLDADVARTPRALIDIARVHAASRVGLTLRVLVPAMVPSLLASARAAAPLACSGALLAEWLATGRGAGYGMLAAAAASDYAGVWARVAAVTAFALALYGAMSVAEARLLARWWRRARP